MHDSIIAERAGVPAVAVMTEKYESAAKLMSRVLGMPDYEFAVIEHPISSATDDDLRERAATAINYFNRIILGESSDS